MGRMMLELGTSLKLEVMEGDQRDCVQVSVGHQGRLSY